MSGLVLSLFPGIGLLDRAFEEEGFCVVRGPDLLWGGDIKTFHPPAGRFDGVIGGPPCQCFSSLANLVLARGYEPRFGNLIPEFERCVVEAEPSWFLMENVPAAPVPQVKGYQESSFILDNAWLGEEQRRRRRFSFALRGLPSPNLLRWIEQAPFELPRLKAVATQNAVNNSQMAKRRVQVQTVSAAHSGEDHERSKGGVVRYTLTDAIRLQGLPEDFLRDAPFTARGKLSAVANGVPLPMGRAVALAVKAAVSPAPPGAAE